MLKKKKGKGQAAIGVLGGAIGPAAGRAHTEYFSFSHLALPVPNEMAGWGEGRCWTREKDFSLFV